MENQSIVKVNGNEDQERVVDYQKSTDETNPKEETETDVGKYTNEEEMIRKISKSSKNKNYDLNQEKALEKIYIFSKLNPFTQEKKSTYVNLQYNSGSYFHVPLPFAREEKEHD